MTKGIPPNRGFVLHYNDGTHETYDRRCLVTWESRGDGLLYVGQPGFHLTNALKAREPILLVERPYEKENIREIPTALKQVISLNPDLVKRIEFV